MSCPRDPNCTGSGYARGCRCDYCRAAHRVRNARRKAERRAARVLIDGRLIAPLPPEHHGKVSTYRNHGCQCHPCTDANAQECWEYRQRRVSAR